MSDVDTPAAIDAMRTAINNILLSCYETRQSEEVTLAALHVLESVSVVRAPSRYPFADDPGGDY